MQKARTTISTPQAQALVAQLPQVSLKKLREQVTAFFSLTQERVNELNLRERLESLGIKLKKGNNRRLPKRLVRFSIILAILVVVFLAVRVIAQQTPQTKSFQSSSKDQRIEILGAKATIDLNREFEFPLRTAEGVEVSKIKYTIEKAELRDEIIVKGQRATAVKGRTFLILNLKITNNFDQAIEIPTKNYVRLTRNNNNQELLAPDIHNDPVEIQAISTKLTRIGFPINDSDTNLKLHLGEIAQEKQIIELNF